MVGLDPMTAVPKQGWYGGLPWSPDGHTPGPVVHLTAFGSTAALAEALDGQADIVVELSPDGDAPWREITELVRRPGLLLSLSTATAWSLDLAARFCAGLQSRGLLGERRRGDVELGLHEAVINAVLHGNLGITGSLLDAPPLFEQICDNVSRALENSVLSQRRVDVIAWPEQDHLLVRVRDQGQGYDPAALPAVRDPTARSGRGLQIMKEVSLAMVVEDQGRSVTMRFPS